jgi:phosphohistidine phosphatase SixA
MPPGGIAVLAFDREAAIEPGVASLTAFWWP